MKEYVIEREGGSWVLRLFGRQDAMILGRTCRSAKRQAFEYVRQWAPCRIRVIGGGFEEWRLDSSDGEWGRTNPGEEEEETPNEVVSKRDLTKMLKTALEAAGCGKDASFGDIERSEIGTLNWKVGVVRNPIGDDRSVAEGILHEYQMRYNVDWKAE